MENSLRALAILLLSPLLFGATPVYKEGTRILIDLNKLLCTQTPYGAMEVEERKAHIMADWNDPKKRSELFAKEQTKAVVGPGGQLYLINGHHFARAVWELWKEGKLTDIKGALPEIPVTIEKDWHADDPKTFWEKMLDEKKKNRPYVYLRDEHGKPIEIDQLPKHVSELRDDPFRSLVWMLKKVHAFKEETLPFQEFYIAEFLRSEMPAWDGTKKKAWAEAAANAVKLMRKKRAQDLVGAFRFDKDECRRKVAQLSPYLPK